MSRYTRDSRDRVFDAVDMLALVGARVELHRRGVDSYFGICPFHSERTESFHVRPDRKHYYCFGCQASGDPFTFVMETEGADFKGALESLADRFGVQLQTEDEDPEAAARRQRRERLYSLLGRAATYYARYLWDSQEAVPARDYLLGRGLTEETLKEFRVGYAPSAWDRILRGSLAAGYSEEELFAAGLISRGREHARVFDRFRERIMFPSADARGRVRGFGARAMRDEQRPKYLNTSDSELYHKRSQLFGIDLARATAARTGRMVLVEGYTDVLALHQAGMRNAVGIMGTALTEEQVIELERIVRVLELCLDADRAGQEAMMRAARLAAGRNLELRVVRLPEGTDPADLANQDGGVAELRERVEQSVPFVAFHIERILARADTRSAEGRDQALAELGPVLAEMPNSVLREELVRRTAGLLELSEARLAALIAARGGGGGGTGGGWDAGAPGAGGDDGSAANGGARGPGGPPPSAARNGMDQELRYERAFLALCIALPSAGAATLAAVDPEQLLTSRVLRRAAVHLASRTDAPLADLPPDDDELAHVMAELVALAGRAGDVTADRLEHAHLLLERSRLDRAIARARAEGTPGITVLAREREHVLERLHAVVTRLERAV